MTAYSKLVDEGASTAYIALEEVERIDRERVNHRRQIAEIEATVAEWSGPPDVDAALDFYNELVDLMRGRIAEAEGAGDLRRELQRVLAGLWAEIADGQLKAEFALRVIDEPPEDGLRQVLARELGGRRMPFANGLVLGDPVERTRRALQTGTQTSIFSCPPRRRSAPARLGSEGRGHR